jgi:short-subunit dehydrogenase
MKILLKPLKDQVIIITGASGGVGLTTARMAADQGAKVVVAARHEERLRQLTDEINDKGGTAVYVQADVGREEDVMRIADTAIRAFGTFDTWVNNAGVSIPGGCLELSIEEIKRMFDTNFWGVVYGSRLAATHLKYRMVPGAIINVGSFVGDRASPLQSTYAVSKHTMQGWTDALRNELEKENHLVSISLIHPGRIENTTLESSQLEGQIAAEHAPDNHEVQVAKAILYCAQNSKHDVHVGTEAKFLSVLDAVSPRLMDKVVEATTAPASSPDDTHRIEQAKKLKEKANERKALLRKKNTAEKVSKNPLLSTLAFAGLGAGLLMFTKRKQDNPDSKNGSAKT